jgi:Ulp1 family protease
MQYIKHKTHKAKIKENKHTLNVYYYTSLYMNGYYWNIYSHMTLDNY